jgi:phosphoenolpyruvate-protein kinase (PTS system EI component)
LGVVSYYESRPSYITSKKITGELVFLNGEALVDIAEKVVVIESADPGYDWVFTKNPAALITKYGGPASHMAIRCAESGLPAVIGAGEMLYDSLSHASSVVIDCENERIEPHGKVS